MHYHFVLNLVRAVYRISFVKLPRPKYTEWLVPNEGLNPVVFESPFLKAEKLHISVEVDIKV